ncbi:MAG TPA: hypothetical protein DDZ41_10870 [Flavobacterium sp.]|nr:hypothetical protein [Flavobacterium sp.]
MGTSESKEETKTVDSTGEVNNNIVIQDPVQIHNKDITTVLYIICAIKIFELLVFVYKFHAKSMKKKYFKSRQDIQDI